MIESNGNHLSRKIKYTAYILSAFAAGLLVVNLFTKTMYYFDENNYYHRNAGWYFYTAITVAIMIFTLGLVWKYWKHIESGSFGRNHLLCRIAAGLCLGAIVCLKKTRRPYFIW